MGPRPLTRRDRLSDVYATPVGRDAIDKLLLQSGLPRPLLRALGPMRISTIERLTRASRGLDSSRAC